MYVYVYICIYAYCKQLIALYVSLMMAACTYVVVCCDWKWVPTSLYSVWMYTPCTANIVHVWQSTISSSTSNVMNETLYIAYDY